MMEMTGIEAKENNYPEIAGLEHVYLEDSYVISLRFDKNNLCFKLLLVLSEQHELYSPPKIGEQYCYRNATLNFKNPLEVQWNSISMMPITDANYSIDFGNIDFLSMVENQYHISGDWGEVVFQCNTVELEIEQFTE